MAGNRGSAAARAAAVLVAASVAAGALAPSALAFGRHGRGRDGAGRGVVPVAAGLVQGTPGTDSFTIQTRSGQTETVDVSTATTYAERGTSDASLSTLSANAFVVVFGTVSGSTVTATKVVIGGGAWHREFRIAGTVQGTPGTSSFTITTPQGASDTVDISSSTAYFERGVTNASLTSLASGDYVAVFGTVSGSTVTASRVVIATAPAGGSSASSATVGTVQTSPSGGSFVIETRDGTQYTVETGSSTTYSARGIANISLTNVAVGEQVAVFGTVSGSTITATEVAIGGAGRRGGDGWSGGGSGNWGSGNGGSGNWGSGNGGSGNGGSGNGGSGNWSSGNGGSGNGWGA